jgi:hypothetical protein
MLKSLVKGTLLSDEQEKNTLYLAKDNCDERSELVIIGRSPDGQKRYPHSHISLHVAALMRSTFNR